MDEALRGLSDIVMVAAPPSLQADGHLVLWSAVAGIALVMLVALWLRRRLMLLGLRWRLREPMLQPCACRLYAWLQRWHTPLSGMQRKQLEQLCFGGEGTLETLRDLLREVAP